MEVRDMKRMVLIGLSALLLVGCAGTIPPVEKEAPSIALNSLALTRAASVRDSHITNWQLLGPFSYADKEYKNESGSQEAIDEAFIENEAALVAGAKIGDMEWREYTSSSEDGLVDLNSLHRRVDYAVIYMAANIHSPEDIRGCQLLLGSDDYIRVWLNGQRIFTYKKERRAAEPDQDTVKGIRLRKGWNTLTIKCVDVVLGWGVYCRIADEEGNPIAVTSQ
jgi:hypothetical protein